jgi:hypothetical protein
MQNVGGKGNSRASAEAGTRRRGGTAATEDVSGASPKGPAPPKFSLPNIPASRFPAYCTAFIMSKIGRYIATTMPPTMTPRMTIISGSIRESRADTATSTSSS